MMRRITVASLVLLLVLVVPGCSAPAEPTEPAATDAAEAQGETAPVEKEKPTLGEFLKAGTKTGDYTIQTRWFEGDTLDLTGEFWVDGRRFRYDIYEGGVLKRSVMSPDGETAYFCFHEKQTCEPSVASVDHYLMKYSMPSEGGVEDGVDEETGATRVLYTIRKTDDMPGSEHPWYSEDIAYLVRGDEVIGAISRGASPQDDGSIDGLDTNFELWSNVRVGMQIPADTFELPYPVKAVE